jgi:hypothetical protein
MTAGERAGRGWLAGIAIAVVVAVGVALLLVALVVRSDRRTALADLEVGDCFDVDAPGAADVEEIDTVEVIDCDRPHVAEVVGTGRLDPDGERQYPATDDELFAEVDARCASFDVPADVVLVPVAPTPTTWEARGGPFACLAVVVGQERVTGSVLERSG